MTKSPSLLGLIGALLCSLPTAPAAIRTWDGSSGANWTTAANWSGGLAPVNGDGLVFPAGAANLVNTNNSSSVTNFAFLTLTGSNYVLRGGSLLALSSGLTNSPGVARSNHVAIPLAVRANQTWAADVKTILTLAGNVTFNGFAVTMKGSGTLDCRGNLIGPGATLFKDEAGVLRLAAGTTGTVSNVRVRDGTLEVNGALSGSLSISNGAALSGSGTVPPFDCAGTVTPGLTGPLTVSAGTAVFAAGSVFTVNLRGTAVPGTDYAQLKVSSPPSLSGASLSILASPFVPSLGDRFVIITNTGAAAFSTAFAGRPEGATQTVNSVHYRISYGGGSGNDVTLTVVGFAASGGTRIWDGGSVTASLWGDPANWTDNAAPGVGDNLVFPFGAARTSNTNNFPTNTPFNSLTFGRAGYQLFGAPMLLLGGALDLMTNGFSTVHARVVLGGPQTFNGQGGFGLTFDAVENAGHELIVSNVAGNNLALQNLSGTGALTKTGPGGLNLLTSNTYAGLTVIASGRINVGRSNALGSTAAGTQVLPDGELVLNAGSSAIHSFAEPLELAGRLSLNSGTNVWVGPFALTGGTAEIFVPNAGGTRLKLAAPITGPGGFRKIGGGFLELAPSGYFYTGATLVEAGVLRAPEVRLPGPVTVTNTGTLEASGTVGPLTLASTNSPRGDFTVATLTVQGPLVCHAGAVQIVDAIGSNPGLFDQLEVQGPVTLAGQLILGSVIGFPPGARVIIIANDGVDAVAGTFAGLPEGAIVRHASAIFTISYAGGDGNDVELTAHAMPSLLTGLSTVTNQFKLLTGQGSKFQLYPIEASTNLLDWSGIGIGSADASGAYSFLDTNAPLFPFRFYRAISP